MHFLTIVVTLSTVGAMMHKTDVTKFLKTTAEAMNSCVLGRDQDSTHLPVVLWRQEPKAGP